MKTIIIALLGISMISTHLGGFDTKREIPAFALSSFFNFAEAYQYFSRLFDDKALETFGNEDPDPDTEFFVRLVFAQTDCRFASPVKIKVLRPELRGVVYGAFVCTDTIIFLNPQYYTVLSQDQKRAILAQACMMMQQRHTLTSTLYLTLIPVFTKLASLAVPYLLNGVLDYVIPEELKNSFQNIYDSGPCQVLVTIINVTYKWGILQAFVNIGLSIHMLKYNLRKYDTNSAQLMGTAEELIQYYQELDKHIQADNSTMFLKLFQPTLKERIKYLSPLLVEGKHHATNLSTATS